MEEIAQGKNVLNANVAQHQTMWISPLGVRRLISGIKNVVNVLHLRRVKETEMLLTIIIMGQMMLDYGK